ncbi:MAG: hypothetical protein JST40_06540 [Armatimonadetes bacterium]|nr:hypothetical protein [Armatimonadota bacterium]
MDDCSQEAGHGRKWKLPVMAGLILLGTGAVMYALSKSKRGEEFGDFIDELIGVCDRASDQLERRAS